MNYDRLELLTAKEHECERKILAVQTPASVLAHAENLEKHAEEIFDLAQKIRGELQKWTEGVDEILLEWVSCKVERVILSTEWCKGSLGDDYAKMVRGTVDEVSERDRAAYLERIKVAFAKRLEDESKTGGISDVSCEFNLAVLRKILARRRQANLGESK